MKLALFDDNRLGIVDADEIVDVTDVVPFHDSGLAASFWRRLCENFDGSRGALEEAAANGDRLPLDSVALHAPVLNPSKIVAAAANYSDHVHEMTNSTEAAWKLAFDVFLKAPSSIIGPGEAIVLPDGDEIHYECELGLVIGKAGRSIDPASALDYVLAWTIGLDITKRGEGDRSRRKSYDTFTPIGPWIVTADEVPSWHDLAIEMYLNGEKRQSVLAGEMTVPVHEIIARASNVMTLYPGDIILTGAPPGVGRIQAGDMIDARVSGLGELRVPVVGVA